jgi:hypothetical protein
LPKASVAGRGNQQIAKRGLGERHGHGVRAREAQQRQHVGQCAAGAVLVLRDSDQRQPHLLDLLPEIGGPYALLHLVNHSAAAALGEEAIGGLEQHVAGFAVHQKRPRSKFTSS